MKQFWRIWAKALGEKANQNADAVALVRTLLIAQAVITNILISINILIVPFIILNFPLSPGAKIGSDECHFDHFTNIF